MSGNPVEVAGVVYESISQAARAHGISQHGMEWRLDSKAFPNHRRLPAVRRPAGDHLVGFALAEPERWPFDGDLTRRSPVLDPNTQPPRIVRRVGWLRCMLCSRPHFSEDVVGIRICFECGGSGSIPIGHISNLPARSP